MSIDPPQWLDLQSMAYNRVLSIKQQQRSAVTTHHIYYQ